MQTLEEKRKRQREYMRKYNATEKGKEYNRSHVKAWREAGNRKPEKRCISREWQETIITFLLERDGTLCQLCKTELALSDRKPSINHILPVALGGPNRMDNLNLVHKHCNDAQMLEIRQKVHGY